MKIKLILTMLVVISALSFLSCKKTAPDTIATQPTNNTNSSLTVNKNGQVTQKGGTILFQASSTNIAAFESAFYASVSGSITGSGRPPACGVLEDHSSMLTQIRAVAGNICLGTADLELTYEWLVFEGPIVADPSPSTFSFTVTDQASSPVTYPGTIVGSPDQLTLSCDPIINACGHVFKHKITVIMPQANFVATTNTTNVVTGGGPGGCGSTKSLSQSVGTLDCGFYLNNPARIYVIPQTGQTHVFTDCSVDPCFQVLLKCPTGGIFEYQLPGAGWPNSPVTLGPNGTTINGLVAGQTYEYRSTLNYSYTSCVGSSQQATGTFIAQ